MNPKVSVIITNYNYELYLEKAIQCALSQSYEFKEIIVVDDGSTDNSLKILKRYKNKIKVISQENKGQAAAFNAAYSVCTGDILCFLDADDQWVDTKLEHVVKKLQAGDWGMIFHDLFVQTTEHKNTKLLYTEIKKQTPPEGKYFPEIIEKNNYSACLIPTTGITITKEVAAQIFPLHEKGWKICADNQLAFSAACVASVGFIDKPLGIYIIHGDNLYSINTEGKSINIDIRCLLNSILCYKKLIQMSAENEISLISPLDNYFYARKFMLTTSELSWKTLYSLWKANITFFNNDNTPKKNFLILKHLFLDSVLFLMLRRRIPCYRLKMRDAYFKDFYKEYSPLFESLLFI